MITIQIKNPVNSSVTFTVFELLSGDDISTFLNIIRDCSCGQELNPRYVFLIETLKSKNLLEDDFKIECCYCWSNNYDNY